MSHILQGFCTLAGGSQNSSLPCVSLGNGSASASGLSLALGSFFTWMHWLVLSWRLESNPLQTPVPLSLQFLSTLSSLVFCPPISHCLGFLEFSSLCLQPGRQLGSISVTPPFLVAWELSTGRKLREAIVVFTIGFLSLRDYCPVMPVVQCLKTSVSFMLLDSVVI